MYIYIYIVICVILYIYMYLIICWIICLNWTYPTNMDQTNIAHVKHDSFTSNMLPIWLMLILGKTHCPLAHVYRKDINQNNKDNPKVLVWRWLIINKVHL